MTSPVPAMKPMQLIGLSCGIIAAIDALTLADKWSTAFFALAAGLWCVFAGHQGKDEE